MGSNAVCTRVHFGTSTRNGIVFTRDVSMTIRPRGTAGGLLPWGYASHRLEDFDGDGKIDILFQNVKTGLVGMSRAMLGKSIAIDLEFFRGVGNTYPNKPTTTRRIRPDLDILEKERVFFSSGTAWRCERGQTFRSAGRKALGRATCLFRCPGPGAVHAETAKGDGRYA